MVFTLYRRLLLSSEINLCLLNIQNSKYKLEVFDTILFNFGYQILCNYTFFLFLNSLRMATSTSKKRKIEEENRSLKIEWEIKYFFVEDSGKYICLICRETIASAKKGNLERHYNSKHQSNFVGILGEARKTKLDNLERNLKSEQSIFSKSDSSVKSVIAVSFAISNI